MKPNRGKKTPPEALRELQTECKEGTIATTSNMSSSKHKTLKIAKINKVGLMGQTAVKRGKRPKNESARGPYDV